MAFFGKLFGWWDGATVGTALWTWRHGVKVGEDAQGNSYYRGKTGTRRWVVYKGANDASRLPPEWYAWMMGNIADVPAQALAPPRAWEKPVAPNMTGTDLAYRPAGALENGGVRAPAVGDYEAWRPDGN